MKNVHLRFQKPRCVHLCSSAVAVLFACAAVGGEVLEAPGVTVEFGPGGRKRAEAAPVVIARARREIGRALGLRAPDEVTVKLLRVKEAFLGVSGGKPVELYAGRAYPDTGTIHVNLNALDREGGPHAFVRTVRHEYVHLAVGRAVGKGKLPRWFEEGLACAFGSPLPRPEAELLHRGRAFRLRGLAAFPRERRALSLAYAQADSVMRFLLRKRSPGAVRDVLRRVRAGEPFEKALLAATGYDVDSLEADWRRSLAPWWGWWAAKLVFSPGGLFLWTALFVVIGFFVVRRRRRRQAEMLDGYGGYGPG